MKHLPEPWKLEKATIFGDESKFGVAIGSTVRTQFGFIYTKCSELPDGSDVEDSPELEATAQRIIDCVNALAGIENPQEFCDNRSVIINNLIEDKRKLKEAGANLLEAMNQYSFFVDGYAAGSASISECNHANDELNKAQNALFELLKTQ